MFIVINIFSQMEERATKAEEKAKDLEVELQELEGKFCTLEAALHGRSLENLFWTFSEYSQENIHCGG